jgi:hypothetical protein
MTIARRTMSLGILALASCQIPPPSQRAEMIADTQSVVRAVTAAYAALAAIRTVHIPQADDNQIRFSLATAKLIADGLPGVVDDLTAASNAQGVVSAIGGVLNLVAPIVGHLDVPPSVVLTFQAATVLLPLIAAAAQVWSPRVGLVSGHASLRSAMTVDQARAVLAR